MKYGADVHSFTDCIFLEIPHKVVIDYKWNIFGFWTVTEKNIYGVIELKSHKSKTKKTANIHL